MKAIEITGLWKKYGSSAVLRDLTFDVEEGTFIILAGPNGAGKTTLLRIISGEISYTKGKVKVLGYEPGDLRVRKQLGVMPQEAELHGYLTVREYLYYLALLKELPRGDAKREVKKVMDVLELQEYSDRRVEELSGGYKRRVLLAQALIGNPRILLLDEPTHGLDPLMRVKTLDFFAKYSLEHRVTILFTTHYLDEIREYADRVLILNRGRIIFNGSVDEMMTKIGYRYKLILYCKANDVKRYFREHRINIEDKRTINLYLKDIEELKVAIEATSKIKDKIYGYKVARPVLEEAYLTIIGSAK